MGLLRRTILAFALAAGFAPAFAQVPPPVPALPDTERRTSYSISGSTCACAVNFALYGDSTDYGSWVEVFLNGVLQSSSTYTITSPTGPLASIARPITDAVLTFNASTTGTVQIVGARRPRRSILFAENRGVAARDLNQGFNDIYAMLREDWDKVNDVTGRAVLGLPGETMALLPAKANRANQGGCFDNNGNLTSCVSVPSSTFSAGSGIAFTGTNPTTITANIQAGSGVNFSGTHPIIISSTGLTPITVTGASNTFSQTNTLVLRSNSGSLMTDTIPGTGAGVLAAASVITVKNTDATALYVATVASGATLDGAAGGSIVLGPGQAETFESDGSNYWTVAKPDRVRLGANTTFYYAQNGSASNLGFSASTPWPSATVAYAYVQNNFDVNGFIPTFQAANSAAYTVSEIFNGPLVGQSANAVVVGNVATPTSVTYNSASSSCFAINAGAKVSIEGFYCQTSAQASIAADGPGTDVAMIGNMNYGTPQDYHITATNFARISLSAGYTISHGAISHLEVASGGNIVDNATFTVTLTGTPAFSAGFANSVTLGQITCTSITWSGAATGSRYSVAVNAMINTGGAGANYFPGNSAGTASTGGIYQ